MSEKRKGILKLVILAVLLAGAQILLKEDGKVFSIWWLAVLLLGWCSFPLCQYLFSGFRDKGYLVAKIFGIAGAGFLMIPRDRFQPVAVPLCGSSFRYSFRSSLFSFFLLYSL